MSSVFLSEHLTNCFVAPLDSPPDVAPGKHDPRGTAYGDNGNLFCAIQSQPVPLRPLSNYRKEQKTLGPISMEAKLEPKRGNITLVACVGCQKKKVKCNGGRPQCYTCELRGDKCIYDPGRVPQKQHGWKQIAKKLEQELQSLKDLLRERETEIEGLKSVLPSFATAPQTDSVIELAQYVQRLGFGSYSPENIRKQLREIQKRDSSVTHLGYGYDGLRSNPSVPRLSHSNGQQWSDPNVSRTTNCDSFGNGFIPPQELPPQIPHQIPHQVRPPLGDPYGIDTASTERSIRPQPNSTNPSTNSVVHAEDSTRRIRTGINEENPGLLAQSMPIGGIPSWSASERSVGPLIGATIGRFPITSPNPRTSGGTILTPLATSNDPYEFWDSVPGLRCPQAFFPPS